MPKEKHKNLHVKVTRSTKSSHKGLTARGANKPTKPGTFPVTRMKRVSHESGIESAPIRGSLHQVHKVRSRKKPLK